MKIFLLLFFPVILFASELKVASFNALHFGWEGKDYTNFSYILTNFDIIGLVEVMNDKKFNEVISLIGDEYTYYISSSSVGSSSYKEYYAWIYKTNKITFISELPSFPFSKFERTPSVAKFNIDGFEFNWVLCHLIFGDKKSERIREAEMLSEIYKFYGTNTIISGDFNLPANEKVFTNLYNIGMTNIINEKQLTTLGKNGYVSQYDNFYIPLNWTNKFSSGYVYTNHVSNSPSFIRKNISDHLPIYLYLK